MKIQVTCTLVFGAAFVLLAADPSGYHFWTHADLERTEKQLAPKMDAHKFVSNTMVNAGNHRFLAVHREASGEAEYHDKETDIVFVQSGEATLVYGGKMIDARTTAPDEKRGPSIEGGTEQKIGPGDVATLPSKLPHQMKLAPGKQLNYFVVKVSD